MQSLTAFHLKWKFQHSCYFARLYDVVHNFRFFTYQRISSISIKREIVKWKEILKGIGKIKNLSGEMLFLMKGSNRKLRSVFLVVVIKKPLWIIRMVMLEVYVFQASVLSCPCEFSKASPCRAEWLKNNNIKVLYMSSYFLKIKRLGEVEHE